MCRDAVLKDDALKLELASTGCPRQCQHEAPDERRLRVNEEYAKELEACRSPVIVLTTLSTTRSYANTVSGCIYLTPCFCYFDNPVNLLV